MIDMSMKKCSTCGEVKSRLEFNKDKNRADGLQCYCKACARESFAKWAKANHEKKREQNAKWAKANPEKKREYDAKRRAANPEKVRESVVKWVEANPEKKREYDAKRRAANPEKERERVAKWRATNPEKVREGVAKYRAANPDKVRHSKKLRSYRNRGAGGKHTLEQWNMLKRRYGCKCAHCGASEPDVKLTRDHIIPVSKGGSNDITNIQPLCGSCNSKKSNRMPGVYVKKTKQLQLSLFQ